MGVLRKDLNTNTLGRMTQCCYVLQSHDFDMKFDMCCGKNTRRYWSKQDECFNYKHVCDEHQAILDAMPDEDEE